MLGCNTFINKIFGISVSDDKTKCIIIKCEIILKAFYGVTLVNLKFIFKFESTKV